MKKKIPSFYIDADARARLRETARSLKKREDEGAWTQGMSTGSSQMFALLDYIEELESALAEAHLTTKEK